MSGEHFIDAEGVRLRIRVDEAMQAPRQDDDLPLVVLHGFTGNAESMESVRESLGRHRTVVRIDLVGHGGSASPDSVECYSMASCTAQIASVLRQLGITRAHLLGYSMGGRAAIATAVEHPECLASLTLVGATAGIADARLRQDRIESDRALADQIESQPLADFVDRWMALPLFASQASLGREALDRARAQRLTNDPRGLANSLRGMGAGAQPPLFDRLETVSVPVLLVVGERDAKFRAIAQALEERFPNARTETVSGVGHAVHLEAVDCFAACVEDFLGSVSSSARRASS